MRSHLDQKFAMSAQDRTLDQYHEYMQINSVSHFMRAAREVGLIGELQQGQRTLEQLVNNLSLQEGPTGLLLDALIAIGMIEKYGDDFALSRAAQLLCQYDDDLGDRRWSGLADAVRGKAKGIDNDSHFSANAATQWVHTPAAIQAAEILNIGGEGELAGPKILDLGCGSAVWSCAMAHQDAAATITAVDHAGAIEAAMTMAESIDLGDRLTTIQGDPKSVELPEDEFDIVLLAQRFCALGQVEAAELLARAIRAAKPGGRIVVIDLFRGPTKPNLTESIEALKLELETSEGQMRSLESAQEIFAKAGLTGVQFTFLAASRSNMGLVVGNCAN